MGGRMISLISTNTTQFTVSSTNSYGSADRHAAVVERRGDVLFIYLVSWEGDSRHSGVLLPTGRPFSPSNDLITVADVHCLSNTAALYTSVFL